MRKRLTSQISMAAMVAILFATGLAIAEVEVYRARFRSADQLVPLVEVAMSEGGRVAVDPNSNSLVLMGSRAEIAQALELLASQDRKPRGIRVEHETRTLRDLEAAGVRIQWNVAGDGFRIGNVVPPPDTSGVAVDLSAGGGSAATARRGSVHVLEGSWGRISSGSSILVPIGSNARPSTAVLSADSGLEVRPRILGDGRIRLDLRPFQGSLGNAGVVSRSTAETTLVVESGRTAVLGGLTDGGEVAARSLGSAAARKSQADEQILLITATRDPG